MLDFIKTTNEVLIREIPNILITSVGYKCRDSIMILNIHFYDLNFNNKAFEFMYYQVPKSLLALEDELDLEFTAFLNEKVKPVFNLK